MSGNNTEMALHYRMSTDAGANWDAITTLTPPDAFGGDTGTVCALGAGLVMDRNDNPLLVTTLVPLIGDSAYWNPAEIWMYDIGAATWSKIHRAESHNLAGGFGSNAAICGRASIGENPENGRLYVAWEQFDSTNVEASTGLLRADPFISSSDDGLFWTEPFKLVATDQTSKRFPVVARDCTGDSLAVFYLQDIIAGFNSENVGAVSNNPVCVWRGRGTGIAEKGHDPILSSEMGSGPVPSHGRVFTFSIPAGSRLEVLDASGRLMPHQTLSVERTASGVRLDLRSMPPGVYLARCGTRSARLVLVP
jgi:hypothetical protein